MEEFRRAGRNLEIIGAALWKTAVESDVHAAAMPDVEIRLEEPGTQGLPRPAPGTFVSAPWRVYLRPRDF